MLIKITNKCHRGCSHCLENSTPKGEHMSAEVFDKALRFARRVERLAHQGGYPPMLILTGGEATDHPDFLAWLERVMKEGWLTFVLTHGMWMTDKEKLAAVLRPEWSNLRLQVAYDPRFYPGDPPPKVDDPRVMYVNNPLALLPLGRAKDRASVLSKGVATRKAPSSFNLRSIVRHQRDFVQGLAIHRIRAVNGGLSGHCSPAISHTGEVTAGESNECFVIGTVDSTDEELTRAVMGMQCNRCGLVTNLTLEQKRAIGESTLFAPHE